VIKLAEPLSNSKIQTSKIKNDNISFWYSYTELLIHRKEIVIWLVTINLYFIFSFDDSSSIKKKVSVIFYISIKIIILMFFSVYYIP